MSIVRDPQASSMMFRLLGQLGKGLIGTGYHPDNVRRLGMSPRQQKLLWMRSWYSGNQYDHLKTSWDGQDYVPSDALSQGNPTPPGWIDNSKSADTPLSARRPLAAYHLPRRVIDTFTTHLFGEKAHPRVNILGDDQTEDYVAGLLEACRFWAVMSEIRGHGGAQGTVGIGFKFVDGWPILEEFDPCWTTPTFKDRDRLILESVEIRYIFMQEVEVKPRQWKELPFWYRRVVDEQRDVYFQPAPVDEKGREPDWQVQEEAEHGFGFFPGVWVPNMPGDAPGDIYGVSDIDQLWDLARQIDELISGATYNIKYNCDSTLVVNTDKSAPATIRKGPRNALVFEKDPSGKASYLESSGVGAESAREQVKMLRGLFLECAACVLDQDQAAMPEKTATEIRKRYGPMWQKLGVLRERWGEYGVKRLVELMIKACRQIESRGEQVVIPPKVDRISADKMNVVERELPPDDGRPKYVMLEWPPFEVPSPEEAGAVIEMCLAALGGGQPGGPQVTTLERAVRKCAPYFDDDDPQATLEEIERKMEEAKQEQADAEAAANAPPEQEEEEPEDEDAEYDELAEDDGMPEPEEEE